jgi:hypothetical protein
VVNSKNKNIVVNSKKKWIVMNPISHRMKKRNPSTGQNGQLAHWWLLVQSGQRLGIIHNLQEEFGYRSRTTINFFIMFLQLQRNYCLNMVARQSFFSLNVATWAYFFSRNILYILSP